MRRFTIRRGSILKFDSESRCVGLNGIRCSVHGGRPLACRLYPLGLERDGDHERFVKLEAAPGSRGVYGEDGSVNEFLVSQDTTAFLDAVAQYASLLAVFRARIAALVDFERVEPREFWRCARREALAESGYDWNPLIDALFDSDRLANDFGDVELHVQALARLINRIDDAPAIAAAAVMLATSLGYSPHEVMP